MASLVPPLNGAISTPQGALTAPWMQFFSQLVNVTNGIVYYPSASVVIPTTGFSVNLTNAQQILVLDPVGTLGSGTITFPPNGYDGEFLQIVSQKPISSVTFTPSGSDTIRNAPTSLAAGVSVTFLYKVAAQVWYRLS